MKGNPFNGPAALQNSTLHWSNNQRLTAASEPAHAGAFLLQAHTAFREMVLRPGFSCIGAKAAFHEGAYGFAVYPALGSADSTAGLSRDLCHFACSGLVAQNEYATLVAVFEQPCGVTEADFEQLLWKQLHQLHTLDIEHFTWDSSVSSDPHNPQFSFSFAGRAFYVVGMHENSSRIARRFRWPALVFNPHEQFERLRNDGKWRRMQKAIRAREIVLQGSVNPMLSDFGEQSEARQYSGRAVGDDWAPPSSEGRCPFGH